MKFHAVSTRVESFEKGKKRHWPWSREILLSLESDIKTRVVVAGRRSIILMTRTLCLFQAACIRIYNPAHVQLLPRAGEERRYLQSDTGGTQGLSGPHFRQLLPPSSIPSGAISAAGARACAAGAKQSEFAGRYLRQHATRAAPLKGLRELLLRLLLAIAGNQRQKGGLRRRARPRWGWEIPGRRGYKRRERERVRNWTKIECKERKSESDGKEVLWASERKSKKIDVVAESSPGFGFRCCT